MDGTERQRFLILIRFTRSAAASQKYLCFTIKHDNVLWFLQALHVSALFRAITSQYNYTTQNISTRISE
jgi:hypothetical protein